MVEMAWLRFGYEDPVIATACVRSVERERLKQSAPQSAGRRSTLRVLLCRLARVLISSLRAPAIGVARRLEPQEGGVAICLCLFLNADSARDASQCHDPLPYCSGLESTSPVGKGSRSDGPGIMLAVMRENEKKLLRWRS